MPRAVPLSKLLEKEIRALVEDARTMEYAQRIDALKLGVDWQKAQSKVQGDAEFGTFFNETDKTDGE